MRDFQNLRAKYFKNPLISYLNINSVRNKIIDLREIVKYSKLNYFVISETKIDERFSPRQFAMGDLEIRARKDKDCHGGGWFDIIFQKRLYL